MEYEKRISDVRAQVNELDALLDEKRTPGLKGRIRFAGHCLDDAEAILRHANTAATPANAASFRAFAAHSISCAAGICLTTSSLVKNYGPGLEEI